MSADTVTILADGNADIAWSVTNTYKKDEVVVKTGGFNLNKVLKGVNAKAFPEGTVFKVDATWEIDGEKVTKTFDLPADGTTVAGGRGIPVGTKVTFSEPKVPTAEGYTFKNVTFSPATLEITEGDDAVVSATNTHKKDDLAATGATGTGATVAAGLALLALGAGVIFMLRRRDGSA